MIHVYALFSVYTYDGYIYEIMYDTRKIYSTKIKLNAYCIVFHLF